MCPEHLSGEAFWRHPDQMTHLAPLNAKKKRLYSEFPSDVWAPHLISKANPRHSPEAPHLCHLYPGSCTFGHNPQLMTSGEGWTVDRPVNRELRLVAQLFLHHRFQCSACMTADPAPACPLITPSSYHLWTRPRDTWTPWLVAFRATNPRFPSGFFIQCLNRLTSLNWIIDWDTACSSR